MGPGDSRNDKQHREVSWWEGGGSEETKGCISKESVLNLLKYVLAALMHTVPEDISYKSKIIDNVNAYSSMSLYK